MGPAPHRNRPARSLSDTDTRWHIVTASNTSLGMSTSMTHSLKKTKEYTDSDSFSTETWQLLQSALSSKTPKTYCTRLIIFYFTGSTVFCLSCHVFQPPSNNIFVVFFLCLVLAAVLPSTAFNHDYNASSRPPSAIHSAFLFSFRFAHLHPWCFRTRLPV